MIDAITFIRSNSQRVPNKSIRELGGIPLLNYALTTIGNRAPEIRNTIVFASDKKIQECINTKIKYTFVKRSKLLDSNSTTFSMIMDHAIKLIDTKYVLYFCVTSPFVKASTINETIKKVLYEDYDSAFLVTNLQGFCWFNNKPLNYNLDNIQFTQDLNPLQVETSGFYIFEKELYLKTKRRIGYKPYIKSISSIEGHDIDYEEDFELAEYIIKKKLNL